MVLPSFCKKCFKKDRWQFWLFFLIFITIRFLPFLFGKTLVFGDNYSLMMPGKIFTAESLKQGVLPLWNPNIFSGMPWISDINQSVFYPSTLLFLIFSPAIALNLLLISHALIAYSGMYLLAKKWLKDHWLAILAGGLWMFSTKVTESYNNFSILQSLVWLPLLSYFGLSVVKNVKARFWFGVVAALQFIGGYPQHVLYGIGLAVLLSAFQDLVDKKERFLEWIKAWSFTAIIVLLFSAVAWIPFLEMLLSSTRMEQTAQQALVGSLNPAMLIKFVLPYFFDNPATGMKWGPAWNGEVNVGIYVTWLGLVALKTVSFSAVKNLFKRKKQTKVDREMLVFFTFTFLSLVFSFGEYLPGFEFIQKIIPLFRIARYPSMVMIMTNVIMILWAIRALQKWQISKQQYHRLLSLGVALFTIGISGLLVWRYGFTSVWEIADRFVSHSLSSSPFHTLDRDKIILFEISRNILFNSVFFLASLHLFKLKKTRILAAVLVLEILVNTQGLFYFAPNKIYDTDTQNSQYLMDKMELENDYRILTRNSNTPYTDYGSYWEAMVVREPFSDSFVDDNELRDFEHVQNLRDGMTPNWNMVFGVPTVHGYTTLLPKDYADLWQTTENPRINFVDKIDPSNELLDQWSVKYYLVDTWFKVDEDLSSFKEIEAEGRWQILERENVLPRFRFEDDINEGIEIVEENPRRIDLRINNEDNSYLIVADRYDKNWRVFINNEEKEVENYNGMRRVVLEEGDQMVTFSYCPKMFMLGFVISSTAALGIGGWLWLKKNQKI